MVGSKVLVLGGGFGGVQAAITPALPSIQDMKSQSLTSIESHTCVE
ncbi:MAG: hypothetical protein Ct9H300mP19_16770 [Dehalococcoidia bacterium]|nr:MAG: hypothetical protein Ct9H300mP19_16770 [Dehalococcoidia bacterium]